MKINTLDEKIRNDAIKTYTKKLKELYYPLMNAMQIQGTSYKVEIETVTGEIVEVYDKQVINKLIDAAIQRQSPSVGDKAINAFIKKVENLQNEIDSIYGNLGQ